MWKRFCLVAFVLAVALVVVVRAQYTWKPFLRSQDDRDGSYTVYSTRKPTEGELRVWSKNHPSTKLLIMQVTEAGRRERIVFQVMECDCKEKRYRFIHLSDDNVVPFVALDKVNPLNSDWDEPVPGSVGEGALHQACGETVNNSRLRSHK